jgi:hypothetical protein
MVTRKWLRAGLIALVLYSFAAAVIGYFGLNAYSGNRGLRAQQDLDEQIAQLGEGAACPPDVKGDRRSGAAVTNR